MLRWVPGEGVVDDHVLAGDPHPAAARRVECLDRGADRGGHRAQVHRQVLGLGQHLAGGGEERGGEVGPLLDVGAEPRPLEDRAHLLGDAAQPRQQDLQRRRIERAHPPTMPHPANGQLT
jgi:hypothetical protein